MFKNKGLTLIELLVVITIIVILLALLMPAIDKAIYQSELAVCETNFTAHDEFPKDPIQAGP